MNRSVLKKFTESITSVLPVAAIVIILGLTPLINMTKYEILVFLGCTVILIIGMSLFSLGADLAMTPMGDYVGTGLTKSKKMLLLVGACFLMGVLITVAEPDLSVLATQVKDKINSTLLIVTVGVGVGIFLVVAVLKIVFKKALSLLLLFFYMVLFSFSGLLLVTGGEDFLSLAFDSGGVTTGPITVPFIMALGVGISKSIGGKDYKENSFGLIALCSVGPIIAVMILGSFSKGAIDYHIPTYEIPSDFFPAFGRTLLSVSQEVAIALVLIIIFFLILQFTILKLPYKKLIRIAIGAIYTFVGLVLFLSAATIAFMPIGYKLGEQLSSFSPYAIVAIAFALGLVVVLAEPAVHVLNKQVEEITNKAISKKSMMIALSIGVAISLALSIIRIIFHFSILYYLIPGYIISLGLSLFVPGIYTAIAFDSGGVASGPLTSSFILPFAIGVCGAIQGEAAVLTDAFGIVAMVAMTPLITIQFLGFKAIISKSIRQRAAMNRIVNSDDKQIIDFM